MFSVLLTWWLTLFAFLDCTVGHLVWIFIQGWLAAPLTYSLLWFVGRRVLRDSNPGWGDWRRSFGFLVVFLLCFGLWAIFKSVRFAFLATGLDAVQRLEQKKDCQPW